MPSGSPARASTARWVRPRSPDSATTSTAASSSSARRPPRALGGGVTSPLCRPGAHAAPKRGPKPEVREMETHQPGPSGPDPRRTSRCRPPAAPLPRHHPHRPTPGRTPPVTDRPLAGGRPSSVRLTAAVVGVTPSRCGRCSRRDRAQPHLVGCRRPHRPAVRAPADERRTPRARCLAAGTRRRVALVASSPARHLACAARRGVRVLRRRIRRAAGARRARRPGGARARPGRRRRPRRAGRPWTCAHAPARPAAAVRERGGDGNTTGRVRVLLV